MQVIAHHQVCDWNKFAMPTFFTVNFWFFADSADPLIVANRLVAFLARFHAFKAPGIYILASAKQAAKDGYLLLLGGLIGDNWLVIEVGRA